MTFVIIDEVFGQTNSRTSQNEHDVFNKFNKLTVRDFITYRVEMEYDRIVAENQKLKSELNVDQPERITSEWLWNKYRVGSVAVETRPITKMEAVESSLDGFVAGRYLLFFDDRQVEELDEVFSIRETKEALFLRITPLQGG